MADKETTTTGYPPTSSPDAGASPHVAGANGFPSPGAPGLVRRGTRHTTFDTNREAEGSSNGTALNRKPTGRSSLARVATALITPQKKVGNNPPFWRGLRSIVLASWFNVLLIFIPISWAMHFAKPDSYVLVFVFAFLAIIPLAKLLAFATDELSIRTSQTIAGLLNATLGNAVELIVAIIALSQCQLQVVQASLIGSILSNLLLVLGMCFFAGGTRFSEQGFGLGAAQVNSSLLIIAVIAVLLPGAFDLSLNLIRSENTNSQNLDPDYQLDILHLSHGLAIILLVIYGSYLTFQLVSHAHIYEDKNNPDVATSQTYNRAGQKHWNNVIPFRKSAPNQPEQSAEEANSSTVLSPRDEQGPDTERAVEKEEEEEEIPQISLLQAIVLLAVVTVLVAITAEFLVDSINGLTETNPSISKEFISIILLAIVGNAAEHVTAVTVSVKDKLTLSIGVAVGSSIQIALFVIPLMVVIGWAMGHPLTLLFDPLESIVLFLAVITVNYVVADGKSNWLEGAILCCLYVMCALIFWYYPGTDPLVRYQDLTCKPRTR